MTSSAPTAAPPKLRPYAVIVAIFMVVEVTGIFEQTMYYVAIPTLMGVFKMDAAGIAWGVTLFLLVGAGTAAISGRLGDIYGRKRVLIVLMIISTVGSLISAIFGSYEGILIGRALQGTSTALFPLLAGIAREVVPARRVPVLITLTTGVAIIGGSLAALLAGVLIQAGSWHIMFFASGALAIIALLVVLALPKSVIAPSSHGRLDILGAVLLAPAVAAILYGVTSAQGAGASPLVVGLIVGGAVVFVFWIIWELRIKNPMFNLRLFKKRAAVFALIATAFSGIGAFAAGGIMAPILQQSPTTLPVGVGLTPTQYGLYGLINGAVGFVLSPVGGRVAAKFGAKVTLGSGFIITSIGYIGFFFAVHSLPLSIIAFVIVGLGTAFILGGIPNVVVEIVDARDTSEAIGIIFSVGRTLFAAIGTAIVGILLASSTVPKTTAPTLLAWDTTTGYVIAASLLGLLATAFILKTKPMADRGEVVEAVAEEKADEVAAHNVPQTAGAA
jgi:MFS family permease